MERQKLVEVRNLKQYFPVGRKQLLKAVDDISFDIYKGETFGLVGESGCGKTTTGRTILNIYKPTGGQVIFDGEDVTGKKGKNLKGFKKNAQMIFQDPYSSLDPRMTIGEIVSEGIRVHFPSLSDKEIFEKVKGLLERVGLTSEHAGRFPHELSGGQRQRVGISRALAVEPEFIVCDEPISALDVSIQAQIVNLLNKLQKEQDLTYLFISHDLSMVKHISDRIGVMYLGSMAEITTNDALYARPLHPYTQALIAAIPIPDPDLENSGMVSKLEGEIPSPIDPPSGCKFSTRCPYAMDICSKEIPILKEVEPHHFVSCHLVDMLKAEGEIKLPYKRTRFLKENSSGTEDNIHQDEREYPDEAETVNETEEIVMETREDPMVENTRKKPQ